MEEPLYLRVYNSPVWRFFSRRIGSDGAPLQTCRLCGVTYRRSCIRNMTQHLRRYHYDESAPLHAEAFTGGKFRRRGDRETS